MSFILAGGGGLLSFNPGFAIWILISTFIFILVMMKYAIPPIMKALNEREAKIKDSLESAEIALQRAESISKDNEKTLREAEVKAQKVRKDAIVEAELLRNERVTKAKDEATLIIEQAKKTIDQEKKLALTELRKEVARLAIESASIILDEELDVKKNGKLIDKFIDDLSNN